MNLIDPSNKYEQTYNDLLKDFEDNNEPLVPFTLKVKAECFDKLVTTLKGFSQGIGVPNNFVEHQSFWLINDDRCIVGTSNLRLRITAALKKDGGHIGFGIKPAERRKGYATILLSETLKRAKKTGVDRVLLTCYKSNIASAKVILKNGGKFDSEELLPDYGEVIQRYWIDLHEKA